MTDFSYQQDYRFAVSDAHRRPAHHLGAPAITWHRAIWKPVHIDQATWIENIELMLLDIYDNALDLFPTHNAVSAGQYNRLQPIITNLQKKPSDDCRGSHMLLRSGWRKRPSSEQWIREDDDELADDKCLSRYETVQIDTIWQSLPVTIRVELFEEYFTLTCFISFWGNPKPSPRSAFLFMKDHAAYDDSRHALAHIVDVAHRRLKNEQTRPDQRQERRATIDDLRSQGSPEYLYETLWRLLGEELLSVAIGDLATQRLGEVFADFRGLVLRATSTSERHDGAASSCPERLCWPDTSTGQSHSLAAIGEVGIGDETVLNWVEALLPLLLAMESAETLNFNPADTIEYTFSTASHRQCLFGTGFGHQAARTQDRFRERPIYYLVLTYHDDHRRIGRLINRLHTMGTLRLASLQDLASLIDVDAELLRLREDLKATANALSRLLTANRGSLTGNTRVAARSAVPGPAVPHPTYLHRPPLSFANRVKLTVQKRFVFEPARVKKELKIETELLEVRKALARNDRRIKAGIRHRATQSAYYRGRFNALVKACEFHRVSGYQPYEQFVRHRLDRAHGKIEEVGSRFAEVSEAERDIRRQFTSFLSVGYQHRIEDIQFWAEVAFLFVLLPYYASRVIVDALGLEAHSMTVLGINQAGVTVVCFLLSALLGVLRHFPRLLYIVYKHPQRAMTRVVATIITFGFSVWLASLVSTAVIH